MHKTPAQSGLSLPAGHIMAHCRWRGTDLLKQLKSKVDVLFIETSDSVVDFYPSNQAAIVYLTESDILMLADAKRRVAKLRKAKGIVSHRVFFAKTIMTQQYFLDFQKMIVLDCGMDVFPVVNEREAGDFIIQMSHQDLQTPSRNPFRSKPSIKSAIDPAIQQAVMLLPKIGETKAKILLEHFKNIRGITEASAEELGVVIGLSSAKHLKSFLES